MLKKFKPTDSAGVHLALAHTNERVYYLASAFAGKGLFITGLASLAVPIVSYFAAAQFLTSISIWVGVSVVGWLLTLVLTNNYVKRIAEVVK